MIQKRKKNNAAIYCRLSVDDGQDQLSQSIENQQEILTKYCMDNGFNIFNIYIDDGFTGTSFDRPGLNKLKLDIESGFIDIVVTKDLSRLGRDHIEMGIFLERYFPDNNIRYIAVNDNVDTSKELDDYVPIKSMVNELYAKDISKKIRATQKFQRETGAFRRSAYPLYGYQYANDGTTRILDPETAPIVAKIFDLFIKGYSQSGISDYLRENKILCPRAYEYSKIDKEYPYDPYSWRYTTIVTILQNKEYLGYYIKGKSTKRFKSKKVIQIPEENRFLFKNVFDPIISKETYELAQKMFTGTRINTAVYNPYSGITYCGICGQQLRFIRHKASSGSYEERLYCKNPNEYGKATIKLDDLNEIIRKELFSLKEIILKNKESFLAMAQERLSNCKFDKIVDENTIKLDLTKKRIDELDNYILKLFQQYEDGIIIKDMYQKLLNEYENEKKILEVEVKKYELLTSNNESDETLLNSINEFINKLDSLDDDNYNSSYIIKNIISKIIITTFKQEDNKLTLGKEIIIYYKACDSLIKEFINGDKNDD